jgi:hypothetical protein
MTSTEYLLKLMVWRWFGTLTWSDSNLGSNRSREADVDEFLRQRAAHEHQSLSEMPLAIRWERGEQTQRPHCHFLLTGFSDPKYVTRNEGRAWAAIWYSSRGLARVRPWVFALRAKVASYMGGRSQSGQ